MFFRFCKGIQDVPALVADHGDLEDPESGQVQLLRHPGSIGIDDLPDQQFIPDIDYFYVHVAKLMK